jgi:hypothetical protein
MSSHQLSVRTRRNTKTHIDTISHSGSSSSSATQRAAVAWARTCESFGSIGASSEFAVVVGFGADGVAGSPKSSSEFLTDRKRASSSGVYTLTCAHMHAWLFGCIRSHMHAWLFACIRFVPVWRF